jgi:phage gp36-like protein
MATYISQSDLDEYIEERTLIQLTDDNNSGSVNSAIVDECIVGAEAEVEGYLAARYAVPITGTVPGNIAEACVVLACRRLYVRRGRLPEAFQVVVEDTMKLLMAIAKGDLLIDTPEKTSPSGEILVDYQERKFTRDTMNGW